MSLNHRGLLHCVLQKYYNRLPWIQGNRLFKSVWNWLVLFLDFCPHCHRIWAPHKYLLRCRGVFHTVIWPGCYRSAVFHLATYKAWSLNCLSEFPIVVWLLTMLALLSKKRDLCAASYKTFLSTRSSGWNEQKCFMGRVWVQRWFHQGGVRGYCGS